MLPKTITKALHLSLFLVCSFAAASQDSSHIDPSKPSNLYTRLGNNLEYNFRKGGKNSFGYRANFVWVSGTRAHSIFVEVPFLYATSTNKFGLSDMRFRHYWVFFRNYEKKPGTLGLATDIYAPTGKSHDGLGSGKWIISPGVMTGFVFGKFSTFPILSYLYSGKFDTNKGGAIAEKGWHGLTLQSITVYNFSKKSYADCTPAFLLNNFDDMSKNDFRIEGNYLYMVKKNKLQLGVFMRRIFKADITTIRANARLYF